jgi:hypothetical protein
MRYEGVGRGRAEPIAKPKRKKAAVAARSNRAPRLVNGHAGVAVRSGRRTSMVARGARSAG